MRRRKGAKAIPFEVDGETFAVVSWPLTQGTGAGSATLTAAEQQVVDLALQGLPNEAIAARRGTSAGTVANQLASVYRKLGVGSRAGLAAWASRRRSGS